MDDGQDEIQAVWSNDEWNEFERIRFECDLHSYNIVKEFFGLVGAPEPVAPRTRSTVCQ